MVYTSLCDEAYDMMSSWSFPKPRVPYGPSTNLALVLGFSLDLVPGLGLGLGKGASWRSNLSV